MVYLLMAKFGNKKKVLPLKLNWSLNTICIVLITMVLFPNIFYFLIDILFVSVTWCSPLRLCSKNRLSTW